MGSQIEENYNSPRWRKQRHKFLIIIDVCFETLYLLIRAVLTADKIVAEALYKINYYHYYFRRVDIVL